jgi:hypothetical protein
MNARRWMTLSGDVPPIEFQRLVFDRCLQVLLDELDTLDAPDRERLLLAQRAFEVYQHAAHLVFLPGAAECMLCGALSDITAVWARNHPGVPMERISFERKALRHRIARRRFRLRRNRRDR